MAANGPTYRVEYRRRRNGKTNYKKRLNLLKSGKPRLVVRISNKHVTSQVVKYNPNGDNVLVTSHSSELKKNFKWGNSMKNTQAAYLTGLLCGFKTKEKKIDRLILDIGLNPSIKGSCIYAALKGVLDSGIEVPHSEEILPDESRISGEVISSFTKKEDTKKDFIETKKAIEKSFLEKERKKKRDIYQAVKIKESKKKKEK